MKSPTHGLRFHDLRHYAITELAESQASDQTIMSIAGHVSPKMLAHYSHVRMDAKRKALDALADVGSVGSYDTNNDTKPPNGSKHDSQVIESNGGREGIRILGLLVANEEKNLIRRGATITCSFKGRLNCPTCPTRLALLNHGAEYGEADFELIDQAVEYEPANELEAQLTWLIFVSVAPCSFSRIFASSIRGSDLN